MKTDINNQLKQTKNRRQQKIRRETIRQHSEMKQLQKATYALPRSWSPSEFLFTQLGQHDKIKVTNTLYIQLDSKNKTEHYENTIFNKTSEASNYTFFLIVVHDRRF